MIFQTERTLCVERGIQQSMAHTSQSLVTGGYVKEW